MHICLKNGIILCGTHEHLSKIWTRMNILQEVSWQQNEKIHRQSWVWINQLRVYSFITFISRWSKLSPANWRPGSGDYEMHSVHASVHLSRVYINLYISFISEDIFTKFAEKVYGLIFKNKMADCLKLFTCSKSLNNEASFIKFAQNVCLGVLASK